MEPKNENNIKISQKIKLINFIYLGVVFIFIILTAIIFFYSTNFIIENVNKILQPKEEINTDVLDLTRYSLVEKKLNLPINNPKSNILNTTTPTVIPVVNKNNTATPVINKKSVTIEIINTTSQNGIASLLSQKLVTAGFSKATTASKTVKTIGTTTILIKDSMKDYQSFIEDVVKKSYSKAITKTNPESSKFDVVITIGK
jgi:hypothetical protein